MLRGSVTTPQPSDGDAPSRVLIVARAADCAAPPLCPPLIAAGAADRDRTLPPIARTPAVVTDTCAARRRTAEQRLCADSCVQVPCCERCCQYKNTNVSHGTILIELAIDRPLYSASSAACARARAQHVLGGYRYAYARARIPSNSNSSRASSRGFAKVRLAIDLTSTYSGPHRHATTGSNRGTRSRTYARIHVGGVSGWAPVRQAGLLHLEL